MIKELLNLVLMFLIALLATAQDAIDDYWPTIANCIVLSGYTMVNTGWLILSEYNALFPGLEFMLLSIVAVCYYTMYTTIANKQPVCGLVAPILIAIMSFIVLLV